jgi:hypothetical protein
MTHPADLDAAEERLSQHAVHYQRPQTDADRIFRRDPDGLTVILFHAGEQAPAESRQRPSTGTADRLAGHPPHGHHGAGTAPPPPAAGPGASGQRP